MPARFRSALLRVPPLARAVLAAALLVLLFEGAVESAEWLLGPSGWRAIDEAVRAVVPGLRTDARTAFVRALTHAGGVPATVVVGIAGLAALARAGERMRARWWAVVLLLGEAVVFAAKLFYQRPRPLDAIVAVHGFSFPSAHAFTGVLLYGLAAWAVWPHVRGPWMRGAVAALAAAVALAVGASRVYLGVHYPTDVLAGWTLGAAWLAAAGWALRGAPNPAPAIASTGAPPRNP